MPKKAKPKTIPPKPTVEGLSHLLLTPAQLRCLIVWFEYFESHGSEPSVRELSRLLDLADTSSARLVEALDKKGAFARKPVAVPGPREVTEMGKKWIAMARAS